MTPHILITFGNLLFQCEKGNVKVGSPRNGPSLCEMCLDRPKKPCEKGHMGTAGDALQDNAESTPATPGRQMHGYNSPQHSILKSHMFVYTP